MTTITVLTPDFESPVADEVHMAIRSIPTEPVVITVLENSKPLAKELLQHLAARLGQRLPVAEIVTHSKATAGKPIDADEAEMLAARSHLVITGLGD